MYIIFICSKNVCKSMYNRCFVYISVWTFHKSTDCFELSTYFDVPLGFSFLFCLAGWPVSMDWLLLDDTPIQAH